MSQTTPTPPTRSPGAGQPAKTVGPPAPRSARLAGSGTGPGGVLRRWLARAGARRAEAPAELFFIGGAYRSGTTWVQAMLHTHPSVFVLDEGWFFNDLGCSVAEWVDSAALERWASLEHNGWARMLGAAETRRVVERAMMESLMRAAAARARRPTAITRIGDKTTFHYVDRPEHLHALFPESRFIHLMRDGRDVAVSHAFYQFRYRRREGPGAFSMYSPEGRAFMERAYRAHAPEAGDAPGTSPSSPALCSPVLASPVLSSPDHHHPTDRGHAPRPDLFCEETLRYFAGVWRHCVEGGRRAAALWGDRFLEIRYEDLHADPRRIAAAFRFLGVAADRTLVDRIVAHHDFELATGGRKRGQPLPTAPRRKGIVGDWRNYFTDRDREVFEAAAGRTLAELGYRW